MKPIRILIGVALLVACNNGSTLAPGATAWEETTTPFDPECTRCEELATVEIGHGGEVKLMVDPSLDDQEAQWVRCVNSVLDCKELGGGMDECVSSSTCPDVCHNEYKSALKNSPDPSDFNAQWNAFELTFMEPTAPCGSDTEEDVEVVP